MFSESLSLRYITSHPAGQLWKVGRLLILAAGGSAEEIGAAHGSLLKTAISEGCVRRLSQTAVSLPEINRLPTWKRWLARLYIRQLQSTLLKNLPEQYRSELAAMARGGGLSLQTLSNASLLSETLQVLAASETQKRIDHAQASGGCTSAVAAGSGSLLHAKNQDYDAAGDWDRAPLLFICRPRNGLAHAKVTSAGLLKGNLSLNEHGIAIGGHFLFSQRIGRKGLCFTVAENEVARRARTLGEAVDIVRSGPHLGTYAFVISDAKAGEAVAIEVNADGASVRAMQDGRLGMSNVYTTELAATDALVAHNMARQPMARQRRVDALLAELDYPDVASMSAILADNVDVDADGPRGIGLTIANPLTVMSAVADGMQNAIWVSEGTVPTSTGRFVGIALAEAFDGGSPKFIGSVSAQTDSALLDRAIQALVAARSCYESEYDGIRATAILKSALAELGPESGLAPVLARLALQKGLDDVASEAVNETSAALSTNEHAALLLVAGKLADISGDRPTALKAYGRVRQSVCQRGTGLGGISSMIARDAEQFSSQPFTENDRAKEVVGFLAVGGTE